MSSLVSKGLVGWLAQCFSQQFAELRSRFLVKREAFLGVRKQRPSMSFSRIAEARLPVVVVMLVMSRVQWR